MEFATNYDKGVHGSPATTQQGLVTIAHLLAQDGKRSHLRDERCIGDWERREERRRDGEGDRLDDLRCDDRRGDREDRRGDRE